MRVLLTGMSATGKSTLLSHFQAEGWLTVDLDDGWIFADAQGERAMDVPRILRLFDAAPTRDIMLAGCEANQHRLYPHLTAVILLTAPAEVMHRRIQARLTNPFGKSPEEWAQLLRDKAEIEPLLMAGCDHVCDTNREVDAVLADIRRFLRGTPPSRRSSKKAQEPQSPEPFPYLSSPS